MSVTILRDKPSFLEHIMSLSREAWAVIRRVHNELNVAPLGSRGGWDGVLAPPYSRNAGRSC